MTNPLSQGDLAGEWNRLLDKDNLKRRRHDAETQYRDLSQDEIAYFRKKAKNDLWFLAYGLLEYDLLSPKLHGSVCNWLRDTRDAQYRTLLLPRGHYKTTVATISETVQMALPNETGTEAHPYHLGPNAKILLAHENRESAARFLIEVGQAFLEKPAMLAFFPELIPDRREQRINKWEIELPRDKHHKEPTFDTIGAGGAAQGRHYHHIKLDDIIGKKARQSDTVMGRTIDWFDNINSLLTRPRHDGWDLIGTRWAFSDVYSHALDKYGVNFPDSVIRAMSLDELQPGKLRAYIRSAIEEGRPIFPEEFSMDFFEDIRESPKVWAAQYANNPREGGMLTFNPNALNYYNVVDPSRIAVMDGRSRRLIKLRNLDIVILIDPSVGESEEADESGIIVTGTDENLNIFVLETVKERLTPPQLIDKMVKMYRKWRPRVLSIEEVAFSATYKYWFMDECKRLNIQPNIHKYKRPSKKKKEAEIEGLAPYISAGQVYILQGMHDLRTEIEQFPLTDSEHLLDALSQGPEVWQEGLGRERWDEFRRAEQKIQDRRSKVTGY